jgi:lysophospholipid acyltransferase (LPLAT)-like uncharacterized protein
MSFTPIRSGINVTPFSQPLGSSGTSTSASTHDYPSLSIVYNGSLYFVAVNSSGFNKLYKWDGTSLTQPLGVNGTSGSAAAKDFENSSPYNFAVYNNELYFPAYTSTGFFKLYKWDGTSLTQPLGVNGTAGSASISDIPNSLTVYSGSLYFVSRISATVNKMHKWDGTAVTLPFTTLGTRNSATIADYSSMLTVSGGFLYFSSLSSSNANKLHKWDGTNLTVPSGLTGTRGVAASTDSIQYITEVNGVIYVVAYSSNSVFKLFKWDGTSFTQPLGLGTSGVATTGDGTAGTFFSVKYNGSLYFTSNNSSGNTKLYKWDGTSLTQPLGLGTIASAASSDGIGALYVNGNNLYIRARSVLTTTVRLLKWDGAQLTKPFGATGTTGSTVNGDNPSNFIFFQNYIYFSSTASNGIVKLFRTAR